MPSVLLQFKTSKKQEKPHLIIADRNNSKCLKTKREYGVYYTVNNPFNLNPFRQWAKCINLFYHTILEPFAGSNNIVKLLSGQIGGYTSYDIMPSCPNVIRKDTMKNFPVGYKVCITNPPWLSSYFASRNKIPFPKNLPYNNIYKFCLELALKHCEYVAMILPASFLTTKLFHHRLNSIILINGLLFEATQNPTCLALFNKDKSEDIKIYENNKFLGSFHDLKRKLDLLEKNNNKINVKFNVPEGEIGIRNIDNTKGESIKFCKGEELNKYDIKSSSRLFTRVHIENNVVITTALIDKFNKILNDFRVSTNDIFLTPFKGLRKDGRYRRRLDYNLAKTIINVGLRQKI